MSVYEPNHYYNYYPDIYGEMQVNILARNREASEMHWRIQQGKGKKGERARHKDEKDAVRKEARRWDCMKWHMKLIHWLSSEKFPAYIDVLTEDAQVAMSPKDQVQEVAFNWADEHLEWERDAVRICTEADGWGGLQVEMERNKFTAKFRQKNVSQSGVSQTGSAFKSAGASSASSIWKSSGGSRVGSSASMNSMNSMSNFKSQGSMASSVESMASSAASMASMASMSVASSVESTVESEEDANANPEVDVVSPVQGGGGETSAISGGNAASGRRMSNRSVRMQDGVGGGKSSSRRQSGVLSGARQKQLAVQETEKQRRITLLSKETQSLVGGAGITSTAAKAGQLGDDEVQN